MTEVREQSSFIHPPNPENYFKKTNLSAAANFSVDPVYAVIESRQSEKEEHRRSNLEHALEELVTAGKVSESAQILTLVYWDELAKKVDEIDIQDAYNPAFMNNPHLSPASLIGSDRLNQIAVPRANVNLLLLATRRALVKELINKK